MVGPESESSTPTWECLEALVREKAQEFIQQIMEEEVTELLGREKSERRSTVDSAEGYRNGYGKPRRLAMSSGTITLRRPRVRGVEERFESRVLPLFGPTPNRWTVKCLCFLSSPKSLWSQKLPLRRRRRGVAACPAR